MSVVVPNEAQRASDSSVSTTPGSDPPTPSQSGAPSQSWRSLFDMLVSSVMLCAAIAVIWQALGNPPNLGRDAPVGPIPRDPLHLGSAPALGSPTARIAMVMFSDLTCPYCAKFATETLPSLRSKYIDTGLVRLVFRHFPLPNHARAIPAATAVECAARQGKFWEMHDRLILTPRALGDGQLRERAGSVGLELEAFEKCLDEGLSEPVKADLEGAKALGVTSTPTFFFGTLIATNRVKVERIISGARPGSEFERVLDDLTGR